MVFKCVRAKQILKIQAVKIKKNPFVSIKSKCISSEQKVHILMISGRTSVT
jgi:hypothetical protein